MRKQILTEVTERLNHSFSIYERNLRNGFVPLHYPTTSLVMGNGTKSMQYAFMKGELRRLV